MTFFQTLFFLYSCSSLLQVASGEATPTCESLGESFYFPNTCVSSCNDLESTMDTDRSRNVGGLLKCFCEGIEQPFCTDDPLCQDLGIYPGTATEDCARICGDDDIDNVEANTKVDHNGYQFHYIVSCTCGDGTNKCGDDFVLFSDQDYMKSCSGNGNNSLDINTSDDCVTYCMDTLIFDGGEFGVEGTNKSCTCLHPDIQSIDPNTKIRGAMACDDASAQFNDGSGLGDPCYENVGVSQIECPTPSSAAVASTPPPTATKTLVSSTAIMGVWLLPW